jgi:flagellar basal-body rod modification protein FlgD
MQNINDTLTQNLDANYLLATSINNTMSATVIGKNVKAYGNGIEYVSGQDTKICFDLDANAQTVKTEILDENGKVVRTFTEENLATGEKSLVWDGKDDEGNEVPEDSYSYRVSAVDNNGDKVSVQTYTFGAISGIRFSSVGAVLMIGKLEVQMSDVYEIVNS